MFDKLKGLMDMQKKLGDMKKGLDDITVDAEVLGGKVKIVCTGSQKIRSVEIDGSLLDGENKGKLEGALKDVINDVIDKSQKTTAARMKDSFGINIPGL